MTIPQRDPSRPELTDLLIPSDPVEARRVQEEIEIRLRELQYEERDVFSIRLALEEAIVNAIKHGNQLNRNKKIQISYKVKSEHFEIRITDEGEGFDPMDVPDPTAAENLERPCGRGLMLMRHYMSEVFYNERGNSVSMKKFRSNGRS
jgi:serine/threonine-protein kinase RsbW